MLLNYIHWGPKPELFTIGDWGPRWYGVLFALSFVCGYYLLLRIFKDEGIKQEVLDSLTIYIFLGTVLGARLGHCLFYQPDYYLQNPLEILMVWKGGLASHGGVIGILIAIYFFARKHKKTYIWTLDRLTLVGVLAGFFIRMGNLINSEIVGKPTTVKWGFVFEKLGEDFARHPSQLYEALGYLLVFFVLFLVFKKTKGRKMPGLIAGLYFGLVFLFRFIIEFTKEVQVDFERGMNLDMGQWLSIPFVLAGIGLIVYSQKQKKALNK